MKLSSSFHPYSLASPKTPGKQVTPGLKDEEKTTEMQSQMQPTGQANLPGKRGPILLQVQDVCPRGGGSVLLSSFLRMSCGRELLCSVCRLFAQHFKPLLQHPTWALGCLRVWELAKKNSIQFTSFQFNSKSMFGDKLCQALRPDNTNLSRRSSLPSKRCCVFPLSTRQ